jgi:hypothetical protein
MKTLINGGIAVLVFGFVSQSCFAAGANEPGISTQEAKELIMKRLSRSKRTAESVRGIPMAYKEAMYALRDVKPFYDSYDEDLKLFRKSIRDQKKLLLKLETEIKTPFADPDKPKSKERETLENNKKQLAEASAHLVALEGQAADFQARIDRIKPGMDPNASIEERDQAQIRCAIQILKDSGLQTRPAEEIQARIKGQSGEAEASGLANTSSAR